MKGEDKRTSKLKKNIVVIALAKGLSLIISLLYIPLLLDSMETDNYAIWLTLTSIVSWITLLDIGLGNGLRNRLSEALANNDLRLGKEYVSTAYFAVSVLSISLAIVFFSINPFFNWGEILNTHTTDIVELNFLVSIVFSCFFLQFALGLINSVLYAIQLPALSSIATLCGQALSFLSVLIIVKVFNQSNLLLLGSIIAIVPPLVLLILNIIIFYRFKNISPSYSNIRKSKINDILSLGVKFFYLQIITIILFQANNLIIVHAIDKEAVVKYNIIYKYLYILVTLFSMICIPIWSATTEAYVKKEYNWIKKSKDKLLKLAVLFISGGFLMVASSKYIFDIWLGHNCPYIDIRSTGLMYIYCSFLILYNVYGYIINGIGKLKIQIIITSLLAIAYIPLAIYGGRYFGLNAILGTMCLNAIINFSWSKIQLTKILNNKAVGLWNR